VRLPCFFLTSKIIALSTANFAIVVVASPERPDLIEGVLDWVRRLHRDATFASEGVRVALELNVAILTPSFAP